METKKVLVGSEEVELNTDFLRFNEATLNSYLKEFSARYYYFSQKLNDAQSIQRTIQDKYDTLYLEKFRSSKVSGKVSDKLADAFARTDDEVISVLNYLRKAERTVGALKAYVRSLEKSHDDALNLGYNIRKEMSTVFPSHVKDILGEN